MHCVRNIAYLVLLLVVGCQILSSHASPCRRSVYPRTSNPPSPSGSGGGSPGHGQSTGLLSDVVFQATRKRPAQNFAGSSTPGTTARLAHSTQGHPSHPEQLTQGHLGHPPQVTQAHTGTQATSSHSQQGLHSETVSAGHPPPSNRLKSIAQSFRPKPPAPNKPGAGSARMSPQERKERAARARAAKGPRVAWWKQAGGKPPRAMGTSPAYEYGKKWRQERKQLKAKEQPNSEHSSYHQPPKGGGPGSPGSGSHAVSKRRL